MTAPTADAEPVHVDSPALCGAGVQRVFLTALAAAARIHRGKTADLCVDCLTAYEIETSPLGTAS